MVYMLQNFLHYTGDYISKRDSELSSIEYPEQNMDFLNKLLFVPYRNENDVIIINMSKNLFLYFNCSF